MGTDCEGQDASLCVLGKSQVHTLRRTIAAGKRPAREDSDCADPCKAIPGAEKHAGRGTGMSQGQMAMGQGLLWDDRAQLCEARERAVWHENVTRHHPALPEKLQVWERLSTRLVLHMACSLTLDRLNVSMCFGNLRCLQQDMQNRQCH